MLARIGVKVNLMAQPKAQYFAKVLKAGNYQTSFYLLGWTPGTFDGHNVLNDIQGCRDNPQSSRGETNLGDYCNKKHDELADKVLVENDKAKRDAAHEGGVQDRLRRLRLHPAAPAGAGLGRVEEGVADPARRQLGAALLGAQGVRRTRVKKASTGSQPRARGFSDPSRGGYENIILAAERDFPLTIMARSFRRSFTSDPFAEMALLGRPPRPIEGKGDPTPILEGRCDRISGGVGKTLAFGLNAIPCTVPLGVDMADPDRHREFAVDDDLLCSL